MREEEGGGEGQDKRMEGGRAIGRGGEEEREGGRVGKKEGVEPPSELRPCKPYMLFILRDVKANLSCALSSYQIEPTARDSPQSYIGIDAMQTLQLFILRDVRANLSCALSSYQIEPTARDNPQN